jgi:hypothetical protein
MRLIAVSRVFNEEDIIEPFVRHHAALVAAHVILDNGSTDRTIPILQALRDEGFNVVVFRNEATFFAESAYNTILYGYAARAFSPDWVLFLDADEFVDARGTPDGLHGVLERAPREARCVRVPMVNYEAPTAESNSAVNVVQRLVRRQEMPAPVGKVFVRGSLGDDNLNVAWGNHGIVVDGQLDLGAEQSGIMRAHYPTRHIGQAALKAVIGRLKVLASGSSGAGANSHYETAFEDLKHTPRAWFEALQQYFSSRHRTSGLVTDPIEYLGGPLRHTILPSDDPLDAISRFIFYAEALAISHGRLIDTGDDTQLAALKESAAIERVL